MVLETLMKLCMTAQFFEKTFCPQNWVNGPKIGFLKFREKFGNFIEFLHNEKAYYFLCSRTNPIFVKNLVPEI